MNLLLPFFLFLLFFTSPARAQFNGNLPPGAELHVRLTHPQQAFIVSIDQRLYYTADGYFSIGNLNGGLHEFKLYNYIPLTLNRIDSTMLVCSGTLSIPPSSRMLIVLDPTKRFSVSQFYNPLQYSVNSNLYNSIYSRYFPLVPYNCQDSTSYHELLDQLSTMPFNDLKLTLIKESIFFNGIQTDQLVGLMQLFPFDKDRIALAAFAFGCCNDPQNFSKINAVFSFPQSAQELKNQLVFYYGYRR